MFEGSKHQTLIHIRTYVRRYMNDGGLAFISAVAIPNSFKAKYIQTKTKFCHQLNLVASRGALLKHFWALEAT